MHIAWVGLCRPHPTRARPTLEALRASIGARLGQLPRCRHRLADPPAGLGDPFWVDDSSFDIARHVVAYTSPDEAVALRSFDGLVDALLAEPLDRSRPLWHFTLVPRLEDGRVGFCCRIHHGMADGIGGMEFAATPERGPSSSPTTGRPRKGPPPRSSASRPCASRRARPAGGPSARRARCSIPGGAPRPAPRASPGRSPPCARMC